MKSRTAMTRLTTFYDDPHDEIEHLLASSEGSRRGSVDIELGINENGFEEYTERKKRDILWTRTTWLAGLLFVQSLSSYIIDSYSELLKRTLLPTLFFTMLVGAGGNAGNQSAVFFIRSMHVGAINKKTRIKVLMKECLIGLAMAIIMFVFGFVRVYVLQGTSLRSALTISLCLFVIVLISVVVGGSLPLIFHGINIDPAHAGTSIQVLMDISGVWITCAICNQLLIE